MTLDFAGRIGESVRVYSESGADSAVVEKSFWWGCWWGQGLWYDCSAWLIPKSLPLHM